MLFPNLFYLHDVLLKAMRSQDVVATKRHLLDIQNLVSENYDQELDEWNLTVETLGVSLWEDFITKNSIDSLKSIYDGDIEILPITTKQSVIANKNIKTALNLIDKYLPEMGLEIGVFLSAIKVFHGKGAMGITDVRMFGCMFIRLPRDNVNPVLYFAEHLTHEVSHMYLNAAMSIDKIILNPPEELYNSPIRPDPRPMIGVFHATFVTSRIVQLFHRIVLLKRTEESLIYLQQQLNELTAMF